MSYNNSNTRRNRNARRNRNRKVTWFNPPYSQIVKQILVTVCQACEETLPQEQQIPSDFQPKHLKLSYCCTTNVWNIIKQHNSKALNKTNDNIKRKCNCRSKPNCPLNGDCLTECLVFKALSTTSSNSFVYCGTSVGEFKSRYNNHTKPFRHSKCMNKTELSKHVWNIKDHGLDNNLWWKIHKMASPYQCGSKRCDLCLLEKVSIICADPDSLLNKRTELISKCRHRNKFCCPTLRNNRHGVVFNCLLQFLYKDTEQNWDILCCSFLLETGGRSLLTISAISSFMNFNSENQLITFTWQLFANNFMLKKCIIFLSSFIAWRLF